jgi:uncharacterized protein
VRLRKSYFMDTSYVQASFSEDDQFHAKALELRQLIYTSQKIWIAEAVLLEVGNAFSAKKRSEATSFIKNCYEDDLFEVVNVSTQMLRQALDLYENRSDKTWGMVDCVSFVVMKENRVKEALTSDKHFVQAGFQALLLN